MHTDTNILELQNAEQTCTDVPMAESTANSRTRDLDRLLLRPGHLVGPHFRPGPEVWIQQFFVSLRHFDKQLVCLCLFS